MLGEPSACQCAVWGHGNVFFPAVGGHLPLLFPEDQVVVALHRDKLGKSLPLGQGVCLAQLPGKAGGDTDVAHFAGSNRAIQPFHDVIERGLVVPHMINV